MIETKEKEIDGHKWTVSQFPGMEAFRVKIALAKLVGPALAACAGSLPKGQGLLNADLSGVDVKTVVAALVDRLDEANAEALVMRLLKMTRCDGQEMGRPLFDTVFAGHMGTLYRVLGFVLEVNYGSFFGALAGTGGLQAKPDQAART